jgi:hypothetical protein
VREITTVLNMNTTLENEKDAGHGGLQLAGHLGIRRGSEREGREREYTTQSPSRERKRVLEVSTDIFGGSTTAPRSFPT